MGNWKPLSPARLHQLGLGVAYGMTDTGLVRKTNEDNFLIDEELGLAVVADGMGGHQAGDVASADAIQALRDFIKASPLLANADDDITVPARISPFLQRPIATGNDPDQVWLEHHMPALITLCDAIDFANKQVYARNTADGLSEGLGMGTTLSGFWQISQGGPIAVFHVGDSRLYRYRMGQLTQLTRDQTLYQQALDTGATGDLPSRNMLLQAVGPSATIVPDIAAYRVRAGDLYLLCSDGLHGKVPAHEIGNVLRQTTADNIGDACAALINLANLHEGKDNTTVVLALCA